MIIPMRYSTTAPLLDSRERLEPCDGAKGRPEDSEPIRLLIVDDIEDNRAILARRFMRRGFQVREADSGLRALDILAGQEFDLVLLDVVMPEMNGVEVLKRIRKRWSLEALPVIMCTASNASKDIVLALDAGANDYVAKPVDFAVAWARVRVQVERKRANAGLVRAHEALNTINTDLEKRVTERTRELAAINDRLKLEILRRQQSDEMTQYLAYHDPLTGLGNRVTFKEGAQRALDSARLTCAPFAIFFIDLDGFKSINDTLGHSVGDGLLKSLAARLRDRLPGDLLIARLGGDEFGILLPTCERADAADSLANDIIRNVGEPIQVENNVLSIATSVGVAIAADAEVTIDELLKRADLAMYRAKEEGRGEAGPGTYRVFDPTMDEAAQSELRLSSEIRNALTNSEFRLHFQPIVSVQERRVSAVEALIRWQHPTLGLLGPNHFIPLAERKRYIVQIGEWVLREACSQAMHWPEDIRVAVNLSPVQFQRGEIIAIVVSALAQSGLAPNRLELEITESVLFDNSEPNIRTLESLRNLGVTISMDDFGTGFSSLSSLRTFPFNKLKIDKSFVRNLSYDQRNIGIVSAIAGLGRSLGMKIVAEGVETEAEFAIVAGQGCAEVQGGYYSMPLVAEDVRNFIDTLKP
jgi:diguanylate cyclase (GGDEF)-like protein